jgi:predicted dehydrogenase
MVMSSSMGRRDFLRAGAVAGAALGLGAVASAEDKAKAVRIGVIGVGSRGTHLLRLALEAGVEVPALCDINPANLNRAIGLAAQARAGRRPAGYSQGPTDYRRMLQRDDLDAVIIGTPMQIHAPMSIDAMRAGKHVLSEVAAAMTIDECWGLIHAAEETGRIYMLSENCCYSESLMAISNMVRKGLFGELTYAECGYVHDCRSLLFDAGGALTWRGELARDYCGNLYPTHSLGPVARWLGINRGDRLVSLVAASTGNSSLRDYVAKRFPPGHPARKIRFKVGDSTSVLIHTAKGAVIDLRYDIYSPHPLVSTTYYSLQGSKASYESRTDGLWIDGRSKGLKWESLDAYKKEFEPALWAEYRQQATGSGHGGIDFFAVNEFLKTVRGGGPSPIDACDAATWSSIVPLSAQSLADGGRPVAIPDFTAGKWQRHTA